MKDFIEQISSSRSNWSYNWFLEIFLNSVSPWFFFNVAEDNHFLHPSNDTVWVLLTIWLVSPDDSYQMHPIMLNFISFWSSLKTWYPRHADSSWRDVKNWKEAILTPQFIGRSSAPLVDSHIWHLWSCWRIVESSWIQCGGHRLEEVKMPCENFAISHDSRGILSMCNSGRHKNNSTQFLITLQKSTWMDTHYVAFG